MDLRSNSTNSINQPHRRSFARLLCACALLAALFASISPTAAQTRPATSMTDVGKVRLVLVGDAPINMAELAARVSPAIQEMTDQFGTLFATQPTAPIILTFATAP